MHYFNCVRKFLSLECAFIHYREFLIEYMVPLKGFIDNLIACTSTGAASPTATSGSLRARWLVRLGVTLICLAILASSGASSTAHATSLRAFFRVFCFNQLFWEWSLVTRVTLVKLLFRQNDRDY